MIGAVADNRRHFLQGKILVEMLVHIAEEDLEPLRPLFSGNALLVGDGALEDGSV